MRSPCLSALGAEMVFGLFGQGTLKRRSGDWVAIAPCGSLARVACVGKAANDAGVPIVKWLTTVAWQDPPASLRRLRRERDVDRCSRVAVLAAPQYQMLQVDAPDVPREDWRDAVRWQLKDMVDFAVDSAAIDLLEIPAAAAPRRRSALIVAAAAKSQLLPLVDQAGEAGAPWSAIDITETALRNLCALTELPGRGQALLHLGDNQATIVITLAGELLLCRNIAVTLAQLTQDDAALRQQAFESASLALQRTLDGFERVFSAVSLSRIMVSPAAAVAEFLTYFSELTDLQVLPLALATALDWSAVTDFAADGIEQSQYLSAIGAALRVSP
jgi:MSHA biogenesis protein MshI